MPVTLEDLVDATRRLSDSNAESAASNRRLADSNLATAAALSKLLSPFEQLRRDIADMRDSHELDQAKLDLAVGRLNTDLALLLDNVKHAQIDVRELQRDVTASHQLPPRDERSTIERVIDRVESAKTGTKVLIAVLLVAFGIGGFAHLIIAAITGG